MAADGERFTGKGQGYGAAEEGNANDGLSLGDEAGLRFAFRDTLDRHVLLGDSPAGLVIDLASTRGDDTILFNAAYLTGNIPGELLDAPL